MLTNLLVEVAPVRVIARQKRDALRGDAQAVEEEANALALGHVCRVEGRFVRIASEPALGSELLQSLCARLCGDRSRESEDDCGRHAEPHLGWSVSFHVAAWSEMKARRRAFLLAYAPRARLQCSCAKRI